MYFHKARPISQDRTLGINSPLHAEGMGSEAQAFLGPLALGPNKRYL